MTASGHSICFNIELKGSPPFSLKAHHGPFSKVSEIKLPYIEWKSLLASIGSYN